MRGIIVTGGRGYRDVLRVHEVMHLHVPPGATVIHGACYPAKDPFTMTRPMKSVDWLAHLWCMANEVPDLPVEAEWGRYGRKAGPIRNARIVEVYGELCELALVFPGTAGTDDMRRNLIRAEIPFITVDP